LGFCAPFRVTPATRPFLVSSRKFAPRCKESDGSHNTLRVAVRFTRLTWEAATARGLFRCERRYDFFEARITARFSARKRRAFFQSARRYEVDPSAGPGADRNNCSLALQEPV